MKKYTLKGIKREVLGRKVKQLRKEGLVPATVYGKKVGSESLSVTALEFGKVYESAGETGLIELTIDGASKPVLIHHVQRDPVLGGLIHIEFHQVDLKEKVHASVPLVHVGEAPAVSQKTGVLLSLLSEVEVEALPADLPEKIDVDVSALNAVDEELKVSDLKAPSGVTILTEVTVGVVKVGALVSKEAEEQVAAEAAAAAESEAAEGEAAAPQAGEKSAESAGAEKKEEEKKSEDK